MWLATGVRSAPSVSSKVMVVVDLALGRSVGSPDKAEAKGVEASSCLDRTAGATMTGDKGEGAVFERPGRRRVCREVRLAWSDRRLRSLLDTEDDERLSLGESVAVGSSAGEDVDVDPSANEA